MECSENQVPCIGSLQCKCNSFKVTHLANAYNIRVLTQYVYQRTGKGPNVSI